MTEPLNPTELAALYRDVPTSTTGFTLCRQEERLMQYLRNHVPAILAQAARIEALEVALRRSQYAIRDMLVGIGVYNDRAIDRHVPIEGPVVTELANAEQASRAALEGTTP